MGRSTIPSSASCRGTSSATTARSTRSWPRCAKTLPIANAADCGRSSRGLRHVSEVELQREIQAEYDAEALGVCHDTIVHEPVSVRPGKWQLRFGAERNVKGLAIVVERGTEIIGACL